MSFSPRTFFRPWILTVIGALALVLWVQTSRIQRVAYVNEIPEWSVAAPTPHAKSVTGYRDGVRRHLVPEHNNRSYAWLLDTERMLVSGDWRIRHVAYDNAPLGRETHAPSLYRWWLALVAGVDCAITGRPIAWSLERAALFADPVLQILLLIGASLFVARQFGGFSAAVVAVGIVGLFPLAGAFLPGAPDHHGLGLIAGFWSLLLLIAGVRATLPVLTRRYFFCAGIAGGLGLWVSVADQTPLLIGIVLGAIAARLITGRHVAGNPAADKPLLPWRLWALGGGLTTLAAYMAEYFPSHMSLQLQAVHPLYAIAWLGAGELLMATGTQTQVATDNARSRSRQIFSLLLAAIAIAALPVAMALAHSPGFMATDALSARLTFMPTGARGQIFSAGLPLVLLVVALVVVSRKSTPATLRAAIALALGPALVALGFACWQLRWFNPLDAMFLPLLAITVAATCRDAKNSRARTRWWAVAMPLLLLPGLIQLIAPLRPEARQTLGEADV